MDVRRRISWTRVAIKVALGVILAIGAPLTAGAETPPGRRLRTRTHPQQEPRT